MDRLWHLSWQGLDPDRRARRRLGRQDEPSVHIAGLELHAKAIKEGSFDWVDLTLLSVDEEKLPINLRMRRMPLCQRPPWAGEPVIVAVPEATARSRIMSPQMLPVDVRMRFPT